MTLLLSSSFSFSFWRRVAGSLEFGYSQDWVMYTRKRPLLLGIYRPTFCRPSNVSCFLSTTASSSSSSSSLLLLPSLASLDCFTRLQREPSSVITLSERSPLFSDYCFSPLSTPSIGRRLLPSRTVCAPPPLLLSASCFPLQQRCLTYKRQIERTNWEHLKADMIDYFRNQTYERDSHVFLAAEPWPRFASKLDISQSGSKVPAIIHRHGCERRICLDRQQIEEAAFDEPDGHLSLLFSARLFSIHIQHWIEQCVVSHVQCDPVGKHIYFLKFARHVPGKLTEVELPVSLVGLLASPAFIKGYHVELAMPTIRIEVVGNTLPPPLQVDVSQLKHSPPYKAITLRDIQHLLPADGSSRFHRSYDLPTTEVVWTYEVGSLPEKPLPEGFVDQNFVNKRGRRIALTYKNYWPKQ